MTAFHFELVAPEQLLFSGDVDSVVLSGTEGEMTVLANQAPLMTTLKPGIITIAETSGATKKLFVRGGFADIAPTGLTILAETAVPLEHLTAARIDAEITSAADEAAAAGIGESARLAAEKLAQLNELKASLKL